ncbi:DUF968 domain-containing protein [Salmonella enterica]|nr:DUF968 domain-containing protein [Salmonella enterica]EEJ9114102.1 DUF968 domain-containing protein [Salmonella enterica subsp. enterica serovar Newport]EAO6291635.1 DUF968 domain-containing protein [Salmonella enterica]EBO9637359.1 DUF968 domain-containing protein [Salmonella enterica]EHG4610894.1 DUF968 domain-containing protein [Salmonella enterica subsp. enterica serovar Newport]
MRAILTAFPQNGARVTLLKSGNLTHRLRDGQRIMICDVPRQLENTPAGEIPDTGQWLAQDEALQSFFSDSRVINAAGGQEGLKTWVSRMPDCQCAGGDHVVNMTTAQTKEGDAVRLCHACDNIHYMKGYRDLSEIIASNRAEWIVNYARMSLRLNADHQLTLPELFCWAVLRGVADAMPVNVIRRFASLPEDEVLTGTIKEADINPWQLSARQLVEKKAGEGMAAMSPAVYTVSNRVNLITLASIMTWNAGQLMGGKDNAEIFATTYAAQEIGVSDKAWWKSYKKHWKFMYDKCAELDLNALENLLRKI